ncbi:glycosyltransferase family 87 protein [Haloactinopolyspora alba]|nr:glycosyltransferase 87 family protein [Haloactinopolyspora alba]
MTDPIATPSRDDPTVAAASEWIGGPVGRRAAPARRWWTPLRIALAVASVTVALGFVADQPCRSDGWADRSDRSMWTSLCYSDVAFLYRERGFADDQLAYREASLEYPVLTGAVMQATAYGVDALGAVSDVAAEAGRAEAAVAESRRFFDLTAALMALCALVVVVATSRTVPRRPWDGMLFAASPLLLLSATINWDLLAVALAALAILAWTRERPVAAGVLIGLGAAVKLYPVLLLGPILLVALRDPERRAALRDTVLTFASAIVAWGAVNLPVVLWAPDGWRMFFEFNAERSADFGSTWYAADLLWPGVLPDEIDPLVLGGGVFALVLIVALALASPEPPRLAQLAFLAVAAFLLVNKVWSPQYSLWLLPLAALARPRVRDLAIWQVVEVAYVVGVWWYLAGLFDPENVLVSGQSYAWLIVLRVAALLWLVGVVVRDVLRPGRDPVRPFTTPSRPGERTAVAT